MLCAPQEKEEKVKKRFQCWLGFQQSAGKKKSQNVIQCIAYLHNGIKLIHFAVRGIGA